MLVLLMYTLLSIFGARLSNSVAKKGRGPFRSISMVNLREGWVNLRVSRNWSGCHRRASGNIAEVDFFVGGFPQSST